MQTAMLLHVGRRTAAVSAAARRQHMTAWRARRILLSAVSGYKWRSAASATVSLAGAGTQSDRSRH